MLKKLIESDTRGHTQVKSSVYRDIRKSVLASYPLLEKEIEGILPKKTPVYITKCPDHVNLISCNDLCWFVQIRDGPYLPSLRTLHKYPELLPKVRVDRGAIPFVLKGANIMCKGLTSKGGDVSVDLPAGTPVAIMAEGKVHAIGIGILKIATKEIREKNADVGIDLVLYCGDGLWNYTRKEVTE